MAGRVLFGLVCLTFLALTCSALVTPIRSESFASTLKTQEFVLVDFHAKWCPFSQKLAPIYSQLSEELKSQAFFASVDVDEDKSLAQKEHVQAVPTVKLFRNGAVVGSYQGNLEADSLKAWIQRMAVPIPTLESCEARAARMHRKALFVAFYKNNANLALSTAPVDSHSFAVGAVFRAVGDSIAVFEHDEAAHPIAAELGGAGVQHPAYALIDWVPVSQANFALRVRFFDNSKPYTIDSLVAWVKNCASGRECPFVSKHASSHVTILSSANFASFVQDQEHDVLVAFVDKARVDDGKQLLEQVYTKVGGVQSLRLAVANADEIPAVGEIMTKHVGSKAVPSIWMFPAGLSKNRPSIAFVSFTEDSASQVIAQFAAQTATQKFTLPKSDNPTKASGRTHHAGEEEPPAYWRVLLTRLAKWLGAFWVEF